MALFDRALDAIIAAKEKHDERERSMTTDEKILREMKRANFFRALDGFNSHNDLYRR